MKQGGRNRRPDPPQHSEDHRARCPDSGLYSTTWLSVSQNSGNETDAASAFRITRRAVRARAPPPRRPWRCGGRRRNRAPRRGSAAARHHHPVRQLLHLDAHAPEVLRHGGDAVGLLDAQLARVAHREPLFARRAQHGQHRDLVDQRRGSVSSRSRRRAPAECSTRISPTSSPLTLSSIQDPHPRAHPRQHVEQRASAWGSAPRRGWSSDEPGTSSAATMKNAAEERSEGTASSRPVSAGRPGARSPAASTAISAPNSRSAISVWSRERTGSAHGGHALGEQRPPAARTSSPARSPPAACNRSGAERAPWISSGGNCPSRAAIAAPISRQRLHDARHGPARKRFVPRDAARERLRRQDARRACGWWSRSCRRPDSPPARAARPSPLPRITTSVPRSSISTPSAAQAPQRRVAVRPGRVVARCAFRPPRSRRSSRSGARWTYRPAGRWSRKRIGRERCAFPWEPPFYRGGEPRGHVEGVPEPVLRDPPQLSSVKPKLRAASSYSRVSVVRTSPGRRCSA